MIKSMFSLVMLLGGAQALADTTGVSEPYYQDQFTLVNQRNFLSDYQPLNPDGSVNVVVERPTGSVQAWRINAKSGAIVWQQDKGKARSVHYLGYPGNYGFVPRTLSSEESGGDGAPLDALVLGPAVPRGEIVKVKLVGMLKLLEHGKEDHKLIGVVEGTPLYDANDIAELQQKFPGVDTIIKTWFANHQGPGQVVTQGFADAASARALLAAASKAYH